MTPEQRESDRQYGTQWGGDIGPVWAPFPVPEQTLDNIRYVPKETDMPKPAQVPYGSQVPRRFTFWQRHGSRLTALALFATGPALVVHWLLCPLWILPVLSLAWGNYTEDQIMGSTTVVHVLLLLAWSSLTLLMYAGRGVDGHWPKESA